MNQNKLKRQSNVDPDFAYDNLTAALDKTVQAAVALGVSEGELLQRVATSFTKNTGLNNIGPMSPVKRMYDFSAGP